MTCVEVTFYCTDNVFENLGWDILRLKFCDRSLQWKININGLWDIIFMTISYDIFA